MRRLRLTSSRGSICSIAVVARSLCKRAMHDILQFLMLALTDVHYYLVLIISNSLELSLFGFARTSRRSWEASWGAFSGKYQKSKHQKHAESLFAGILKFSFLATPISTARLDAAHCHDLVRDQNLVLHQFLINCTHNTMMRPTRRHTHAHAHTYTHAHTYARTHGCTHTKPHF